MLTSAAALGAVATGTLSTLLPALERSAPVADAAEAAPTTLVAAGSTFHAPVTGAAPALVPVSHAVDGEDGFARADRHLAALDKGGRLADELAQVHAAQEREATERARIDEIVADGGLDGWIAEALRVLDLPQSLAPGVKRIVMKESTGNPNAINTWDSNAARGTPSQGLMQTIPSTFAAYVHPDLAHLPITHPVANLTAGINYMIDNYGLHTLADGGRSNGAGRYIGY